MLNIEFHSGLKLVQYFLNFSGMRQVPEKPFGITKASPGPNFWV
jgi:hypothetical protein